jgi:glyoxylase-like metal-dependent hydrolase (beta-lactamase superfamily II)
MFPLAASLVMIGLMAPMRLSGEAAASAPRTVTKLADGIYAIRHRNAPDHFPQGNTVVIIGDTSVLVVDSCYLPSSAREDIEQIRQWTAKPVRYLFNTHWHGDHNQGNAEYAAAFPALAIVAHTETAKLMALRVPPYLSDYPHRLERFQKQLDNGKDQSGRRLTDEEKEDLKNAVAGGRAASDTVSAEFRGLTPRIPDITFDNDFEIDLGHRHVQLKHLGRGNTAGDAIGFLPAEKIVITGDLVDSPVPYLGGGFPIEQVTTLKRMLQLDFETIVPGHGDVLKGRGFVQQEIALIEAVIAAVTREIGRTSDAPERRFDEIKKAVEQSVDVKAWRQKFAGDDPGERELFDGFAWPGLVAAAHAEMWPR